MGITVASVRDVAGVPDAEVFKEREPRSTDPWLAEHVRGIRVVREERKKKDWDIPDFTDAQVAKAVAAINAMTGTLANDNYVPVPWPTVLMPITAAALDFGNVSAVKIKLSDLVSSQGFVKRDRLLWHTQNPGKRNDQNSPFVSMPITTEDGIIIDGHHALCALFLLAGPDLKVPVWLIPIGLATGHLRGA